MSQSNDDLMTTRQAAELIDPKNPPVRFLEELRRFGGGPVFFKLGHKIVRYRRKEFNEWVESNLRSSTSDSA